MTRATWQKKNRKITGQYEWQFWSRDYYIVLDSKDPVTGQTRRITTSSDKPEFNGWKLVK